MTKEDYDNLMLETHLELQGIEDLLNELKINFEY
jgi:hypothetical protein